ncbi:hypothetical protein [Desertibaculum subflavum]|uniref:hypothetical protein n=1 Tax=Desertibaculum subflavum TaxID=2268458 RepID=UPI000E663CFD
MDDLDQKIRELLDTEILADTRDDLLEFKKQLLAGRLPQEDAEYVRALHDRVMGGSRVVPIPPSETASADPKDLHLLKAENAELRRKGRIAVAERDKLRALIADLEANRGYESNATARFEKAKKAFARLYHPDNQRGTTIERAVRTEIFKEFWAELEKIENE